MLFFSWICLNLLFYNAETYNDTCMQMRDVMDDSNKKIITCNLQAKHSLKVIAEELTSTKQEEKKRFIIKGVVDPRTGDRVAFRYAVSEGIIDHAKGLYVNPDTGEGINYLLNLLFLYSLYSCPLQWHPIEKSVSS